MLEHFRERIENEDDAREVAEEEKSFRDRARAPGTSESAAKRLDTLADQVADVAIDRIEQPMNMAACLKAMRPLLQDLAKEAELPLEELARTVKYGPEGNLISHLTHWIELYKEASKHSRKDDFVVNSQITEAVRKFRNSESK